MRCLDGEGLAIAFKAFSKTIPLGPRYVLSIASGFVRTWDLSLSKPSIKYHAGPSVISIDARLFRAHRDLLINHDPQDEVHCEAGK